MMAPYGSYFEKLEVTLKTNHFSICQYLTQKFIIRLVQHTIFKMRRIPIILLYKQPFFFYNNLVAASEKSFFYCTALQIFQINGGILQ